LRAPPVTSALILFFAACMLPAACSSENNSTTNGANKSIDTAPIDLALFPIDPTTRARVIYMSPQAAVERLGALHFEAKSTFEFNRGGQELEQNDLYSMTQDSSGNFHVVLDTPESQIEIFLVGETVYVRHDKGHLREKPRRDVEVGGWRELAFSSVSQALELFSPHLTITDPSIDETTPRKTMRYSLGLSETAGTVLKCPPESVTAPVTPTAQWRELARPLDLRGNLWVDAATGVLTRVTLDGRMEIQDRQVRPTQLKLHFDSAITDAGKVATVRPGSSIPELKRNRRPRDPLSFFRDQLPKLEDPEGKQEDAEDP